MSQRKQAVHWLFGDQLGPRFLPEGGGVPVVMVEARAVFARRRFHRAKAHLVLSAMRHRAAELGERVRYVRAQTYAEVIGEYASVTVRRPTSRAALALVAGMRNVEVLPERGFLVPRAEFATWADEHGGPEGRLRQEDFYRWVRRTRGLLMEEGEPLGGRWNFDHDNREGPPRGSRSPRTGEARERRGQGPRTGEARERRPAGQAPAGLTLRVPPPYRPREDAIDAEVRWDLDRWERDGDVAFVGRDGPRRFPATRREALAALRRFVDVRLETFGPYEDAMLAGDPVMSHSLLSSSLNLGLLDPAECVARAEAAGRAGDAPMRSVEGFVRQIAGWREYVWQLYWYFGEEYRDANELRAHAPLPEWFLELDADAVTARCLATALRQVRDTGWTHHIPRLMLLGSHALQRGWDPRELADWFHRCFVDGYDWVMLANVLGMSQYADGGRMTSKPYTSGGSYVRRMSDLCGGCAYRPDVRTGERACPYTAGYWAFLHRHRERLARNHRTAPAVRGLDRLKDLEQLLRERRESGDEAP